MNFIGKFIIICILGSFIACSGDDKSQPDPVEPIEPVSENIYLADPTIYFENGTYYLYGTSQGDLKNRGNGYLVFTSDDLMNWEGPSGNLSGFALRDQSAFGSEGFWAPQILKQEEKYLMAYTANEKIGIAESESPLGPFTNSGNSINGDLDQIDPFIFIDDDGKKYLFHVRLDNGNRIYVAEMEDDLGGIKTETLTEVISAEEDWENTENATWPVAEGPTVFKNNDTYYLIYSANDFRNPDYAVGYATSDNLMGPWTKSESNPLIHGDDIGKSGAGHGDLFWDENNRMQYVLHTHFSENSVHPRKTGIIELNVEDGNIVAKTDSFRFLERTIE